MPSMVVSMGGWLFTSVSGETSWQSNDGYDDVLGTQYVYDSGVAYHRQVAEGDVILIRESDVVLGVSRIDRIDSRPDAKRRKRCPFCGRTGVEFRVRTNEYACANTDCRRRFATPDERLEPVTRYTALYGARWQALDGAITYAQLAPSLQGVAQNAIRPCDVASLGKLLTRVSVSIPAAEVNSSLPPIAGGRRLAQIRARVGQGQFRTALLRKYGLNCAVTGACPAEVLEAAHLMPFAEHESHDVDTGLLLRADIHQLLDSGLLMINPDSRTIELSHEVMAYADYRALHGRRITQDVSAEALRTCYAASPDVISCHCSRVNPTDNAVS